MQKIAYKKSNVNTLLTRVVDILRKDRKIELDFQKIETFCYTEQKVESPLFQKIEKPYGPLGG